MLKIRALEIADKEQMLGLMHEFWMKYNREGILTEELKKFEELKDAQDTMLKELNKYFKWLSFVAEEEDKLVGFIVGDTDPKEHKVLGKQGYIEEFFVTESRRGEGIGSKLFETLLTEFKKQDCKQLGIDAYVVNKDSINYYKKLGFIERSIVLVREI